jgi:hypothetical protein
MDFCFSEKGQTYLSIWKKNKNHPATQVAGDLVFAGAVSRW